MLKKFFSIGVMALLFVACDDSSSANSSEKEDTKDTELPRDSVSAKDLTVARDTTTARDTASSTGVPEKKESVLPVDPKEAKDTASAKYEPVKKDSAMVVDSLKKVDTSTVVVPLCGGREYDTAKESCYSDVIVPSNPSSAKDCADIPEYPYFDSEAKKCIATDPNMQPCPDGAADPQDLPVLMTPVDPVVPADSVMARDTVILVNPESPEDSVLPYNPGSDSVVVVIPTSGCAAGSYYSSGSSTCVRCPEGTYQDQGGMYSCKKCPMGTYSSTIGATSSSVCTTCPVGTYSSTIGATSSSTCKSCPAGYVCPVGSSCYEVCPAGSYCPEGSKSAIKCPAGTYSSSGRAKCTECPVGYTSEEGSARCTAKSAAQ